MIIHHLPVALLLIAAGVFSQRFGAPPIRNIPQPQQAASQSNCALIIPNAGQDTCITFDAVNNAFNTALRQHGPLLHQGPEDKLEEASGELGLVIQETSRILATQYNLSKDAISQGLPLIDTTKTVINQYCPESFREPKCEVERYRSMSGVCNNLDHPLWGKADIVHQKFLPPNFGDGISVPRLSVTGAPLPSPRLISRAVHTDDGFHDHAVTIFLVFWGQFVDHDMSLTSESKDPLTGKTPNAAREHSIPIVCRLKLLRMIISTASLGNVASTLLDHQMDLDQIAPWDPRPPSILSLQFLTATLSTQMLEIPLMP